MNVYSGQSQNTNGVVDLNNLYDYLDYEVPDIILALNNPLVDNELTNEMIILGRVLFYDKNLSVNNTVSCASCHKQERAFGDSLIVSQGWNGEFTKRHTPKLINLHYAYSPVFWDLRNTLSNQPLETIANPIEMGFSGTNGQPGISALPQKLEGLAYYPELFELAYGDPAIDLSRVSEALV